MDAKELYDYQLKLLGDPDKGVEPSMSLSELDPTSEEYKALRPYALGAEEWPEYTPEVEEAAVEETVVEEFLETPGTPVIEVEAPAVVEARDRVKLRQTAREAFEAKVSAIQEILDRPKPADKFSDEYEQWQEDRQQALIDMNSANGEYIRARDVEDIEHGNTVVQKSEVSTTINAIGTNYPELKLPYSYEDGVNQYNAWAAKASAETGGDLQAAYAKFQSDPAFTAKVGPLPENHEILFIHMNAVAASKNGGSLKGHILALADDEGVFARARTRTATIESQNKTQAQLNADALNQRATEQRPPGVKSGQETVEAPVVKPHDRMTQEQAMGWLEHYQKNVLKKPMTSTERVEYSRLRDIALSKITQSEARSAY